MTRNRLQASGFRLRQDGKLHSLKPEAWSPKPPLTTAFIELRWTSLPSFGTMQAAFSGRFAHARQVIEILTTDAAVRITTYLGSLRMRQNSFVMLLAVLSAAGMLRAGELDSDLAAKLEQANPDDVISTLVHLNDRVDPAVLTQQLDDRKAPTAERHETLVRALRQKAQATQPQLVAHLNQLQSEGRIVDFETFWIANVIRVDAVPDEIITLSERNDVQRVYFNYPIEGIRPVEPAQRIGERTAMSGGVEPGIEAVRAPEVWAIGFTGEGSLVATLDTGVDGNHPALASRWRGLDPAYAGNPGWAFFDPVTNWQFPQDSGSHGTHTMGSVCGGSPGDSVGVAPGAEWIHAAVIDRGGGLDQTVADAILAFQWLIDPDGDPGTNFDVPDVCSNSWGLADFHGVPDCDEEFWNFLDACEAAGIVIVFSAGNEGSGGLRRPSDRATDDYRTMAVAAVDGNNPNFPVAGFSSRGPTFCTPGGQAAIKPDISAPGVDVRSSVPGGGYSFLSGTSMASPHINGVIALMRQANPNITVQDIKQIIYDTALDLGPPGEDNDYGWGIVDAFEAVQITLSTAGLTFTYPDGRPDLVDPEGGTTIRVLVSGDVNVPVAGTGKFYYSPGGAFVEVPMEENAPHDYTAILPAFECGAEVSYYFSAETESGDVSFDPFFAPENFYVARAFSGFLTLFGDDFETNQEWTVTDSEGLTDGSWERGVPLGGGDRGDPESDADGSGQCFVTGLQDGDNDVDDGTTVLSSPLLDASDQEAYLSYYRWFANHIGDHVGDDVFVVEVSDDGGLNWTVLESIGPGGPQVSGDWFPKEYLIAEIPGITNTDQFRVRFVASDLGSGSVVEAGIDAFAVGTFFCAGADCPADLDGDGAVGAADLAELLGAWGSCEACPADFDGDGLVGASDLAELLGMWGPCP